MNKSELIDAVSVKSGFTKKDSEIAVNAVFDSISDSLVREEKVVLVGFGTFETKHRAARICRNPSTKEELHVPASKAPSFKAGKGLKEKVNA